MLVANVTWNVSCLDVSVTVIGSAWWRPGIIERFEEIKMGTKMTTYKNYRIQNDIKF